MDCVKCGAPLPPKSNICTYCGALNDVDLRAIGRRVSTGGQTERFCPHCEAEMQVVELGAGRSLQIERCEQCLGIFFDPGELDSLLDTSAASPFEVDHERLTTIIEEEGLVQPTSARYLPCPVCKRLMNRKRYGSRSGVIVDRCREHGVWLDGGELGQLLKWAKAGGREHTLRKRQTERKASARRARAQKREDMAREARSYGSPVSFGSSDDDMFAGLLGSLARLLR